MFTHSTVNPLTTCFVLVTNIHKSIKTLKVIYQSGLLVGGQLEGFCNRPLLTLGTFSLSYLNISSSCFRDKTRDECSSLRQGQEEADISARHCAGGERGQHQEELQQTPPLHHHQG